MKILYVEDNPINAMIIETALSRQGHEMTIASTAEAALEEVSKGVFELVLMDINLGESDIDGTELMHMIRKEYPAYQEIPFFAITAYALEADRNRFLRLGFQQFFAKPIDIDELINTLTWMVS